MVAWPDLFAWLKGEAIALSSLAISVATWVHTRRRDQRQQKAVPYVELALQRIDLREHFDVWGETPVTYHELEVRVRNMSRSVEMLETESRLRVRRGSGWKLWP